MCHLKMANFMYLVQHNKHQIFTVSISLPLKQCTTTAQDLQAEVGTCATTILLAIALASNYF